MVEVVVVVRAVSTESDRVGKGLAESASATHALLVVEALRRHVRHHDGLKRADVDAHFHRRGDAQYIDGVSERILRRRLEESPLELSLPSPLLLQGLCLPSKLLDSEAPSRTSSEPSVIVLVVDVTG